MSDLEQIITFFCSNNLIIITAISASVYGAAAIVYRIIKGR